MQDMDECEGRGRTGVCSQSLECECLGLLSETKADAEQRGLGYGLIREKRRVRLLRLSVILELWT